MRPTKAVLLFDGTSVANTAFDTGDLNTTDYDALLIELIPSAAAGASTLNFFDSPGFSNSIPISTRATPATAAVKTASWGAGEAVAAAVGEFVGSMGGPLPASVRIGIGALGAAVTCRIRVIGRRAARGTILRPRSMTGLAADLEVLD